MLGCIDNSLRQELSNPVESMFDWLREQPITFYLTGSRYFLTHDNRSDVDVYVQDGEDFDRWLEARMTPCDATDEAFWNLTDRRIEEEGDCEDNKDKDIVVPDIQALTDKETNYNRFQDTVAVYRVRWPTRGDWRIQPKWECGHIDIQVVSSVELREHVQRCIFTHFRLQHSKRSTWAFAYALTMGGYDAESPSTPAKRLFPDMRLSDD